ncbi:isotrichodermin C-15 hydroxylase [Nannizzia gypsea CBS 118893]|uniref:Isotrichodermin C-15 hydroxylase n=1 Tax=Arthroderma gypseum (strain ATCC MYA-4604 / CBS 118893) TaxID=535722 RepID=E4UTU5_ARTGP|nr:isotrichodermin C-15 hydroxylase [Nannizzia gypsea CBS 118893]EFR01588.1 isotrichodermin C-15 hydroxylase [Nannizzia gypsea CBS 118893]
MDSSSPLPLIGELQGKWIISFIITVIAAYISLVAAYRLMLHPLAKYPGPFWNKLSDWPFFFEVIGGDHHLECLRQHEIYGPIVRTGPNKLSVNSASAMRQIYHRSANVQRSDWYLTLYASASYAHNVHSETNKKKHSVRRRVMEQAFSDAALRSSEEFIVENIKTFCDQLSKTAASPGEWGTPQNMDHWCTYLSYDIMGDLVFNTKFNCLISEDNRYVPELLITATQFLYNLGYLPFVRFVRPLLGTKIMEVLGGQLARDGRRYNEYGAEQMSKRLQATEINDPDFPKKDLMHYLINAKDPETGQGLTGGELAAESSLLIAAGSDTTSTALSGAIFYLIHNPECLEKARTEIQSAFSSAEEIRGGTKLNGLTYLRAIIDETLRLSPSIPSNLMVETLPGGITVDGNYIAEGMTFGVSPYVLHRNAQYFPDPYVFRPERWIGTDKPCLVVSKGEKSTIEDASNARYAFFAFSAGPRGCMGKNLAYLELLMTLATLIFNFDMRIILSDKLEGKNDIQVAARKHPGRWRKDEYQLKDHFVPEKQGPIVQFRERTQRIHQVNGA